MVRRPYASPLPHPAVPGILLLCAILTTQIIAALIVGFGLFLAPIPSLWVGYVWAYCIAWTFLEDLAKVAVYHHLDLTGTQQRRFLSRAKLGLFAHGTTPPGSKSVAT